MFSNFAIFLFDLDINQVVPELDNQVSIYYLQADGPYSTMVERSKIVVLGELTLCSGSG